MPKGRLEAFSDGVIAIVITLLVLEIRIPQLPQHTSNHEVLKVLTQLVPSCAAYLISFAVCAVWSVAHHNFIHDLARGTDSTPAQTGRGEEMDFPETVREHLSTITTVVGATSNQRQRRLVFTSVVGTISGTRCLGPCVVLASTQSSSKTPSVIAKSIWR